MRPVFLMSLTALLLSGCASHFSGAPPKGDFAVSKAASKDIRQTSRRGRQAAGQNKWLKGHRGVRVAALSPALTRHLVKVGQHFGKPVFITSGCRSPQHNRAVGGVNGSFHLRCLAADFNVPGVPKRELARFVRNMPGRGGVGVYCGKSTVHLDVGPRRDWYRACTQRKRRAAPILTGSIDTTGSVPQAALSSKTTDAGPRGQTVLGDGIALLLSKNP